MVRLALFVALLLTGCAGDLTPEWRKVSLPVPAGSTAALGDLVRCGDRLYAVGAVRAGATRRPAAWTSTDGTAWSSIPVAPASIYGPTSLLYAAGCRGEALRDGIGPASSSSARVPSRRRSPSARRGRDPRWPPLSPCPRSPGTRSDGGRQDGSAPPRNAPAC